MSAWRHVVCHECWADENGAREPHRLIFERGEPYLAVCCRCGHVTASGIFVRGAPVEYTCGGDHDRVTASYLIRTRMMGTWMERDMIGGEDAETS